MQAQQDPMSPRKLDAIRANGSQIMGKNPNNLDAASNYRQMQQTVAQASATGPVPAMMDARQLGEMDAEITMNSNLHLVPSRWERSGWRYVQKDPKEHGFFNNPNRVNNFGIAPDKRRFASVNRDGYHPNRSGFGNSNSSF